MKQLFLLICLLIAAALCRSQSIEGTWRGVMIQDSPVARINFEMVLEKKEGKINGYLYRLFIVDDSLIYNTVKINARIADNVLIIEDDESVSRNFEEKANRKIKAAYFFKLNPKLQSEDSLKGEWTTSRYKNKYMSISGTVLVAREPLYETTQLFKRLEEKQLQYTVAFVPKFIAPVVAINTTTTIINPSETKPKTEPVKTNVDETKSNPAVTIPVKEEAKEGVVKKDSTQTTAAIKNNQPVEQNKTKQPITEIKPQTSSVTVNNPKVKQEPVVNNQIKTNPVQKKDSTQSTATINNNQPVEQNKTKQPTTETKPQTNSVTVNNPPVKQEAITSNQPKANPALKKDSAQSVVAINTKPPVQQNKQQPVTSAGVKNQPKKSVNNQGQPTNNAVVKNDPNKQKPVVATQQPTSSTPVAVIPVPEKFPAPIIKTDGATINETNTIIEKPTVAPPPIINNPLITTRATEVIQTLTIAEDSVVLSLYDNGEIDGDVVSVFLNNEKIIENITLKASAYKKTIYFKPGETVQLTLFAENLGSVPPNTGLLVVYSGDKRYQVFFTSTLNKSSVVLLKRQ